MISNNPKKLLILLGSIAFLAQGYNYAAAPLIISIAEDLNLSIPSAALSITAYATIWHFHIIFDHWRIDMEKPRY